MGNYGDAIEFEIKGWSYIRSAQSHTTNTIIELAPEKPKVYIIPEYSGESSKLIKLSTKLELSVSNSCYV